MIYLDVTSACHSTLNTGVKRMQRGLHSCFRDRPDYRPVCWQSARRGYRTVGPEDLEKLEQTSTKPAAGAGLYDSFAPGLLSDWLRLFSDTRDMLKWPLELKTGDVLLVPDLLWDNRGAFLARLHGTSARRIGIFHDAIALRRPEQSRLDHYFCARGVRSLASLDCVICISRESENDLHFFWRQFGRKPAPTHVVPWPAPFTGPRPAGEPHFSAKRLLCVARLEAHKNHMRLLAACEKLWREGLSFELQLIGCKAYPDTAWQVLRRVRSLQKDGRPVRWTPHVDEAALHAAYRDSSFTVLPSLLEGFGLPIIESLWHGRPVVCGTNGALGEVAAGGGCLAVDTQSEESIAHGLRLLLTNEERYKALYAETQSRPFRTWKDYEKEIAELFRFQVDA
jgi:glycosyltransferase involved in cell wall biosynthesis